MRVRTLFSSLPQGIVWSESLLSVPRCFAVVLHVLNFFFELDSKLLAHAPLQLGD
jgi:hypothetical protein